MNYLLIASIKKPYIRINLKNNKFLQIKFLGHKDIDVKHGESFVEYGNIWDNIDIRLDMQDDSLKESIRVKNKYCRQSLQFKIRSNLNVLIVDDKIAFVDSNKNIAFYFEKPFIILKNESVFKDNQSISHFYDRKRNVYSIKFASFNESDYPIIIDPTVVFRNEKNQPAQSENVGSSQFANLYLTGTNARGDDLGFSNLLTRDKDGNYLSEPIVNGSDIVSFNRKVLAKMDFLSGSTDNINIESINVFGGNKISNVFTPENIEIPLFVKLTPNLLYVPFFYNPDKGNIRMKKKDKYVFNIRLSENINQFDSYNISYALVAHSLDDPIKTLERGSCSKESCGKEEVGCNIIYIPPLSKPILYDYVLLRIIVDITFSTGDIKKTISRSLYSYIQFIDEMPLEYLEDFAFVKNRAKNDAVNGDFYAPTSNRGLVVIDGSLGVVRTIDMHNGLDSKEDLNILSVTRMGSIEKHTPSTFPRGTSIYARLYKGLLVSTAGGTYYYDTKPYEEPATYSNPYKVSNKSFVDMVMSGPYLWLLSSDRVTIYRIGYKHLINYIVNFSKMLNSPISVATMIDAILDSSSHQPFHADNFKDGVNQYASILSISSGGVPEKMMPISILPNIGVSSSSSASSIYSTSQYIYWNGISILYKDKDLEKKVCLTIVYAPIGNFKDAYSVYDSLYNYFDEEIDELITVFPDNEDQLNRAIYISLVDAQPHETYSVNDVSLEDKPKMNFVFNTLKDPAEQFNEISIYGGGPIVNSSSRVIIGTFVPWGQEKLLPYLEKTCPKNNMIHFCPQNVIINNIEESGPYFNPITGEEIND